MRKGNQTSHLAYHGFCKAKNSFITNGKALFVRL